MADPHVVGASTRVPGAVDVDFGDGRPPVAVPIEQARANGLVVNVFDEQRAGELGGAPEPKEASGRPPTIVSGGVRPPRARPEPRELTEQDEALAQESRGRAAARIPESEEAMSPEFQLAPRLGLGSQLAEGIGPFGEEMGRRHRQDLAQQSILAGRNLTPEVPGTQSVDMQIGQEEVEQFDPTVTPQAAAGGPLDPRDAAEQVTPEIEAALLAQDKDALMAAMNAQRVQQQGAPGAVPPGAVAPGARRGGGAGRAGGARVAGAPGTAGFGQQLEALEAQRHAIARGALARNALLQNAHNAAESLRAQREDAEDERQRSLAETDAALSQARDAVARRSIDPNKFWRTAGEGNRVAAALAIGAGQLGSLMGGGSNTALAIIRDSVNKNIAAQETDLAQDERLLSFDERAYARMRSRFGDDRVREEATRVLHWQEVGRMLDETAAQTTDARTMAQLQGLAGEISREQAIAEERFRREQRRIAQMAAARRARVVAEEAAQDDLARRTIRTSTQDVVLPDPAADPELYQQVIDQLKQRSDLAPGEAERLARIGDIGPPEEELVSPGGTRIANEPLWRRVQEDDISFRDAMNISQGAQDIVQTLDEAIDIRRRVGAESLDRRAVAQAAQLQNRAQTAIRLIQNTGTPQEFELEVLEDLIPNATSTGGMRGLAQISGRMIDGGTDDVLLSLIAARQNFAQQADTALRVRGLEFAEPGSGPANFQPVRGQ